MRHGAIIGVMSIQTILKMGDPRLLALSQPVRDVGSPAIQTLVQDLWDTMRHAQGAGLAAPQIGVNLQVIVFGAEAANPRYPQRPLVERTVLINPTIEPLSDLLEHDWEGCLSIPGLRGRVPRFQAIRYRGLDAHGMPIERVAEGFHARVVQHEYDHLHGILYPMRMDDLREWGYTDVLFPELAVADTPRSD